MKKVDHSKSSDIYYRYHQRQMTLSEVGVSGQKKLRASSVLIVGLGGLGIPVLQYLSGSGIGHIGVVDFDRVEISNLSRQPFYFFDDIGQLKSEVVEKKMKILNPLIEISSYSERVDLSNIIDLFKPFDLIIDATDNFSTKFLIHDTAHVLRKKLVQGAIYQYEGLLRSFDFSVSSPPCLRCLWEHRPEDGCTRRCQEAGLIPATAGVVGSYQAMVAIQLLLGWGSKRSDFSQEICLNLITNSVEKIGWRKDRKCLLCSQKSELNLRAQLEKLNPTKKEDPLLETQDRSVLEIAAKALRDQMDEGSISEMVFIDVREQGEMERTPLAPLLEKLNIGTKFKIIDKDQIDILKLENPSIWPTVSYIVVCQSGQRSRDWILTNRAVFSNKEISEPPQMFSLQGGINHLQYSVD